MSVAPFTTVPYGSKAFVIVHTCEYLLKVFDVEANSLVRTISRKYDRVESPPPTDDDKKPVLMINNKTYGRPLQKFLNDITNVIVQGDKIWAVTSTKDAKKGTLIDVFDSAGKYIDAFYLNIPSGNYAVYGDHLYAAEKNPDDTYAIKKYRIEWRD
jgi:hypothetical protein